VQQTNLPTNQEKKIIAEKIKNFLRSIREPQSLFFTFASQTRCDASVGFGSA
jgi:hypothetical protein